jgi:hypothetical protein
MQLILGLSINVGQPLWQTLAGLGLILLGIWIFRWVVAAEDNTELLAYLTPLLGINHTFRRTGFGGLVLTMGVLTLSLFITIYGGFLVLRGCMNRIKIDETNVTIYHGFDPVKRQVWDDFEKVESVPKGTALHFKEGKRYSVNILLPKKQLSAADAKLLLDWLVQRFPGRVLR